MSTTNKRAPSPTPRITRQSTGSERDCARRDHALSAASQARHRKTLLDAERRECRRAHAETEKVREDRRADQLAADARLEGVLQRISVYCDGLQGTLPHMLKERIALLAGISSGEVRYQLFVTMANADKYDPDLYAMINLSFDERRRLLAANPFLAAAHFEDIRASFFKHILNGDTKPLGEIVDYWWRAFDDRGGAHGRLDDSR